MGLRATSMHRGAMVVSQTARPAEVLVEVAGMEMETHLLEIKQTQLIMDDLVAKVHLTTIMVE